MITTVAALSLLPSPWLTVSRLPRRLTDDDVTGLFNTGIPSVFPTIQAFRGIQHFTHIDPPQDVWFRGFE